MCSMIESYFLWCTEYAIAFLYIMSDSKPVDFEKYLKAETEDDDTLSLLSSRSVQSAPTLGSKKRRFI